MKYILFSFICIIALGGFYITFSELKVVQNEIESMRIAFQLSEVESRDAAEKKEETSKEVATPEAPDSKNTISTAIIFTALSSPLLQPQANTAVIIEGVSEDSPESLTVHIKAFTNEATSYSALDAGSMFEIVDLKGLNRRARSTSGNFDSMPPKTAISGEVVFARSPEESTVILQVNTGEEVRHYEFNFEQKTYKEIVLG
jgi:hypothetical protein